MTVAVIILSVVLAGIVGNLITLGVFFLIICEGSKTDDKSVGQCVLTALIPYLTFVFIATVLICAEIDRYKKKRQRVRETLQSKNETR